MKYTIEEIKVSDLTLPIATCIQRVWENPNDKVTPEEVLKLNHEYWSKQDDPLLLVARDAKGTNIGFRFAHAVTFKDKANEKIMFDENGGVLAECRRHGIGRALLKEQHKQAKTRGYTKIRTGVATPLKPMIILNLNEGFDIINFTWYEKYKVNVVWFEKKL